MSTHRIKFAKRGNLIFVSHLDFAHSFTRALKRAELPVKYSEGFSPHPKQVFALPLSVGMVGENELCDITLTQDFSHDEIKSRLQKAFTNEIEIKEVYDPDIKMGKVKSAKYSLCFEGTKFSADELLKALSNLSPVVKKTKSGNEKELDLNSMVYSYDVHITDGNTVFLLELASSGESYLNPELVLTSLKNMGFDLGEEYDITRTDILFEVK